jgi:hypothetical protein
LIVFYAIVVQVQRSFNKTKTQNNFFSIFILNFSKNHIFHLIELPMITMGLKWHHENIFNKIQFSKNFGGRLTWFLARLIVTAPILSFQPFPFPTFQAPLP